ncbi:MAG TPA: GNAT family N-acyltransferase [Candidatus Binatia bacterium]|jgi:N-acyl-L-homoserine lactone synthetase
MFDDHFEVLLADTPWAKAIHYNLRYRVYCVERGYENPEAFPDGKERDHYDDFSRHFLIRSFESGEWLAALRIIKFPFEALPINRVSQIEKDRLPDLGNAQVAELSRLCAIAPKARLAFDEIGPVTSWVSMAFMRAARAYALENNIRYLFVLIADSLARILNRAGIEFLPVGPMSEYRGKRRPYVHDVRLGYQDMPFKAPRVYEMFCNTPAYRFVSQTYPPNARTSIRAKGPRSYDSVPLSRSI